MNAAQQKHTASYTQTIQGAVESKTTLLLNLHFTKTTIIVPAIRTTQRQQSRKNMLFLVRKCAR